MKLDILAIGVHPDDVELGCAGTLMKQIDQGYTVGIVDLTKGELGTRGTVATRKKEALDASKIMGVQVRENLGFKDGFFANDEKHQRELIKIIRKYQPSVVISNAKYDRHPDHGRSAQLTYDACFLAGLSKVETSLNGKKQPAYRPKALYHYIQAIHAEPDFVVDITNYFERKLEAIHAYKTQFYDPKSKEKNTFISSPEFLEFVRARASHFGVPIGVRYAEGFTTNRIPGVNDLVSLL
ncbi:MAG TPA: bacillithiol biosynthesis deacetylase BshB1 [Chitinophagales bacterium]|nr:bacillithiol biosynthesis deacetylase BshB1 [Chitinophagales bacterium]